MTNKSLMRNINSRLKLSKTKRNMKLYGAGLKPEAPAPAPAEAPAPAPAEAPAPAPAPAEEEAEAEPVVVNKNNGKTLQFGGGSKLTKKILRNVAKQIVKYKRSRSKLNNKRKHSIKKY